MTEARSIDELEISVRSMQVLQDNGIATLGQLLATDVGGWPGAVVSELRAALEELDITWDVVVPPIPPFEPPAERAVARAKLTYRGALTSEHVSRLGGLPSAPAAGAPWPAEGMKFLFQVAGADLGMLGVTFVQVFADMTSDYYDASCQRIVVLREPCTGVLDTPAGIVADPISVFEPTPGFDDGFLLDIDAGDDEALEDAGIDLDYADAARRHAWCDKIRGVPVGANVEKKPVDSRGAPMSLLLQLVTFDDWFLWYLFANADYSELALQVVRG